MNRHAFVKHAQISDRIDAHVAPDHTLSEAALEHGQLQLRELDATGSRSVSFTDWQNASAHLPHFADGRVTPEGLLRRLSRTLVSE